MCIGSSEAIQARDERPNGWAFLAIGGGAAVAFIGISVLILPFFVEQKRWVVSTALYAAFILPVYLLHRRYSFESSAAHRRALPRYIAVQGMAVGLATLFGWLVHAGAVLPVWLASSLVIALTTSVNFIVLKAWAFAQPEKQGGSE